MPAPMGPAHDLDLAARVLRPVRRTARPSIVAALVVLATAGLAFVGGWREANVAGWVPTAPAAGPVVVALLVADVVVPIPATVVMAASGAALGPLPGSLVNVVGLLAAALIGHSLGRAFGHGVARRPTGEGAARVGSPPAWAVAASRGVPVASEAVALAAGFARAPLGRFTSASLVGSVVVGTAHGVAGASAVDHPGLAVGAILGALVVQAALLRAVRWRPARRSASTNG